MRITVLDSDPDQAALLCELLAAFGHSCSRHRTGKAALDEIRRESCDLLVTGWQVPDMPAQELVTAAHGAVERIPVLAIVSRAGEQDAVSALKAEVDDYIVAPIRRNELVLRFDYGHIVPWVRRDKHGLHAIAGPDAVYLVTPAPLHGENMHKLVAVARVIAANSSRYFSHALRVAMNAV